MKLLKNVLFLLGTSALLVISAVNSWPSDDPFQDELSYSYSASRFTDSDRSEDESEDQPTATGVEKAHGLWLASSHGHPDANELEFDNDAEENSAEHEEESWRADPTVLSRFPKLGQVAALAFNKSDKSLVVFHRGSAVWDENTFSANGTFQNAGAGPIREDTIVFYDTKRGFITKNMGKNLFYMPHGMSLGRNGAIWVTDVALHQVFKLVPTVSAPFIKAELILGEAFQPGADDRHFCKPTSFVEAATDGSIFVADGYCNGRVMKFNGKTGSLLSKFGRQTPESTWMDAPEPGTFFVPHSLALIESSDLICVGDRENRRIQCFVAGLRNNSNTGRFIAEISHSEFREIYAIKYAKKTNVLLALSRDSYQTSQDYSNKVFAIDASTGRPFEAISIAGMVNGHDLAVDDANGLVIYASEIGPNQVWRITRTG